MSAWSELRDQHALGHDGAVLLYQTVRSVARARHFPPPPDHERWTIDAVAELAHDFVTGPRASERLIELAASATDDESFARLLSQAVLNHLRGEARRTAVGKLVVRLKNVLDTDGFTVVPVGTPGAGNITLPSSPLYAVWNGDSAPLLRAAYAARDVTLIRWRSDSRREPPLADADSLRRVSAAVLSAAEGSMRFADLASVVGARFGLSATPAVIETDSIDLTPDEVHLVPGAALITDAAVSALLAQLSDRDRLVLAWLGEPLSVIADRSRLPRSTTAFVVTRLRQKLETALAGEPGADEILLAARDAVRAEFGLK